MMFKSSVYGRYPFLWISLLLGLILTSIMLVSHWLCVQKVLHISGSAFVATQVLVVYPYLREALANLLLAAAIGLTVEFLWHSIGFKPECSTPRWALAISVIWFLIGYLGMVHLDDGNYGLRLDKALPRKNPAAHLHWVGAGIRGTETKPDPLRIDRCILQMTVYRIGSLITSKQSGASVADLRGKPPICPETGIPYKVTKSASDSKLTVQCLGHPGVILIVRPNGNVVMKPK